MAAHSFHSQSRASEGPSVPEKSTAHRASFEGRSRPRLGQTSMDYEAHRSLVGVYAETPLLASPGPLESMLKTTTETGDIGVFSIRARPSTTSCDSAPPLYHYPSRPRPRPRPRPLLQSSSSSGPRSTGFRRPPGQQGRDDRRTLPSYKNATLKVSSAYGSDSHSSSGVSSLYPPSEDLDHGHHTWSMTTYGSRQLYNQRSSSTLQTLYRSHVQRPRSPYPYPTRLKRPGVHPSSPAMTENGRIDYSRMVQIDRISCVSLSVPACTPLDSDNPDRVPSTTFVSRRVHPKIPRSSLRCTTVPITTVPI